MRPGGLRRYAKKSGADAIRQRLTDWGSGRAIAYGSAVNDEGGKRRGGMNLSGAA
jgi:hypothetical protein